MVTTLGEYKEIPPHRPGDHPCGKWRNGFSPQNRTFQNDSIPASITGTGGWEEQM
jgi:hypothetical protein